jgi:hypothetical protein
MFEAISGPSFYTQALFTIRKTLGTVSFETNFLSQ